jgi:hypothetical protein
VKIDGRHVGLMTEEHATGGTCVNRDCLPHSDVDFSQEQQLEVSSRPARSNGSRIPGNGVAEIDDGISFDAFSPQRLDGRLELRHIEREVLKANARALALLRRAG